PSLSLLTPPTPPDTYTLSLPDALPISRLRASVHSPPPSSRCANFSASCSRTRKPGYLRPKDCVAGGAAMRRWVDLIQTRAEGWTDRKSTRLNSSHLVISYAVFCLKKKK